MNLGAALAGGGGALKTLPDESVHCCVSSPPYWGLRDYGVEGQIGLETSLGEHIDMLVEVFAEVRRVLRKDGTPFPNLFAGGGAARGLSGPSDWGYLSGSGLMTATNMGRLAGEAAARLVKGGN